MKLSTAAKLGRISNLPTVWTNVLAGVVLAGAPVEASELSSLGLLASLLYVAGMFLNDAFDAEIDARERPERPIPAGEVSRAAVLGWGLLLLGAALLLASRHGTSALLAAVATAAAIVLYDLHHKGVRFAPLVMGLCRVGLYLVAAFAVVASPPTPVWTGALALLGYVVGLTFVAKHENQSTLVRLAPLLGVLGPLVLTLPLLLQGPIGPRLLWLGGALWVWRSIRLARGGTPRSIRTGVVSLIAGIALVDALLVTSQGRFDLALVAVAGFGATLALQRLVAGT
jgi:4-hydroxybenzoate polyprenyltransferase